MLIFIYSTFYWSCAYPIKAFLTYGDLFDDKDNRAFNAITLKRKLYPNLTKFTEFSFCIRVKIKAFQARHEWSQIWAAFDGVEVDLGRLGRFHGINREVRYYPFLKVQSKSTHSKQTVKVLIDAN